MDNAIGYSWMNVARLLVSHGARVEKLWHAAALGHTDTVRSLLSVTPRPAGAINQASWHACAGGQRRCAALLAEHGADLDFTHEYGRGTVVDAASNRGTQRTNLIEWLEDRRANRTG